MIEPVPVVSESSGVLNNFRTPVTRNNSFRPTYEDVLTRLNEELDQYQLCDAPAVSVLPFLLFDNENRYPTFFAVVSFCRIWTADNELKVWYRLSKFRLSAVEYWGGCNALEILCVGEEKDSSLVPFHEEVGYE